MFELHWDGERCKIISIDYIEGEGGGVKVLIA